MFKVLLPAALLAAASLAQAQTQAPSPAPAAKKELVARVLQLQQSGIEAMAKQLAEQPAMQLMQRAGQVLQTLPAERREALARDIEADVRKYAEETTPLVRANAVKFAPLTIGPLLEERFSEEELKQIVAMLDSPIYRRWQQIGPEMQRALGERLVAESRTTIEGKLRALDQTVAKRLGLTPQPAASAASGAKK